MMPGWTHMARYEQISTPSYTPRLQLEKIVLLNQKDVATATSSNGSISVNTGNLSVAGCNVSSVNSTDKYNANSTNLQNLMSSDHRFEL